MEENPYNSPSATALPLTPLRLKRGQRVLFVMGAIAVAIPLWEVLNYNLFNGWSYLPFQLFRAMIPLALIGAIWKGHAWARYLLGVICACMVCVNLPMISNLSMMIQRSHFGDAAQLVILLVGYFFLGTLSIFSGAITGLLVYRRDQQELYG